MSLFKYLSPLLIGFCAVCASGCTDDDDDDNEDGGVRLSTCSPFKIINGDECTSTTIPVVELEVLRANGTAVCTGTVIGDDFVLTAAHCLTSDPRRVLVRHDNRVQDATEYGFNPLYLSTPEGDPTYDVGLLRVDGFASAANITPATIGLSTSLRKGDRVSVVGFGLDENGNIGTALPGGNPRGADLKIDDIDSAVFITRYEDGEGNPCFGDSGASAVKDGKIVGIESAGTAVDCRAGDINIFTLIKTPSNINFIQSNVPDAQID